MRNIHEETEQTFEFGLLTECTAEIDVQDLPVVSYHDVVICRMKTKRKRMISKGNLRSYHDDRLVGGQCQKQQTREMFETSLHFVQATLR